ncbi:MAG: LysM peptidoglycan-binding domain-containing protein [Cellvibrionaceae bacterium]
MLNRCKLVTLSATLFLAACNQTLPVKSLDETVVETRAGNPFDQIDWARADRVCESSVNEDYQGPEYTNLWNRLRAGYQFDNITNSRVQKHLDWYAKHPKYIKRVTERGQLYLHHIVEELEKRDMPTELALLPIVESAFDPFAYSHGRASGMWQFIPATGRQYGLKQNWWYDGRRDALASTNAAVEYLDDLNRRFRGDWLLALASYNAGGGNVNKSIRRNRNKGKPTDFWSLDLPRETESYVPQLIALSKIILEPEKYNIELTPIANVPYFSVVNVGSQIDLAQAASLADVSLNDLYKLNAGFNRWATDPKGPHRLLVPVDKSEGLKRALGQLPHDSRISWERYKVKSGDSLLAIAKHFNTTADVLRDQNNIRGNMIRQGQMMLIPKASQPEALYALSESQRVKRIQNRSKGKSGTRKVRYTVKSGDSLWSIARTYNVKVSQLAKWNAMAPKDTLKQNQKLIIWSPADRAKLVRSSQKQGNAVIRKVAYQVRKGDSLARIAGKFNLSVNDIKRWNSVQKSKYIHPGQSLTLFVDVTRTN